MARMNLGKGMGRKELERRVVRLLSIALLLRARRMTRAQLAQMFHVSERQVQRDLLVLKAAGLRIRRYGGRECGYQAAWPEVPDLESWTKEVEDGRVSGAPGTAGSVRE